jgi:predicted Zn-dependent protease
MTLLRTLLLTCVCAAPCLAQDDDLNLPDIGDSTGMILSPEYERRLGQAFLNHVRKQAPIIADHEVEAYISSIGYRLVSNSDNNTQNFTFFVINDAMINAFAAPGGIVGINSGVLINSESESELAGVMAHEVAHVTQRHMARSAEMSSQMSVPMMAAMLGAILIATQNPEAGQAAIAAVQGGMMQAQINFTRHNEEEADRIGIQLMDRAGYDAKGMPAFFEKLQKNSRYFAQAPEFLRSHPLTTNRIADTQARVASFSGDRIEPPSRNFPLVRAKLMVMAHKNPADATSYFANELEKSRGKDPTGALHYGLALALMRDSKFDAARDELDLLLDAEPENSAYLLARADLEVRRKDYDAAIRIYARTEKLYPDYRPLVFNYANTLLISGRPAEARDILKRYGKLHDPDLVYFDYLARAEQEAGNPVDSGIASAEYYYLSGETRVAIERLRYILQQRNPIPDYYQQERIHDRLAYYEQELQIERDLKLVP